jgi:precorrin-3B methylase
MKGVLCRIEHRAVVASLLHGLADGVLTAQGGDMCARGDILIVLRSALTIADVSVGHPPSVNTLSAVAATVGAPATHHDALKQASQSG